MKDIVIIRNNVSVEPRGNVVVLKVSETNPYVLRLLGTSCNTDTQLYVPVKSITLSLDKGKKGVVAVSLSSPNGRFYGRDMFEVTWVGENKDKVFVNLHKSFSSSSETNRSFSMTENGIDIYGENRVNYRIPFVFWGDMDYYHSKKDDLELVRRLESFHRIIRDGNTACCFIAGDASMSDVEAAHMEYRMEDPDFLKQIAKEVVVLRNQVKKVNGDLEFVKLDCQLKLTKINNLEVELGKTVKALVYIKSMLSRPWMTWWNKLTCIGTVFNPKHNRYVGVNLK